MLSQATVYEPGLIKPTADVIEVLITDTNSMSWKTLMRICERSGYVWVGYEKPTRYIPKFKVPFKLQIIPNIKEIMFWYIEEDEEPPMPIEVFLERYVT